MPFENLLWAKVLRASVPHARIVNIDTSKAKALKGVRAVLTGADVKDIYVGTRVKDQPVLAYDKVRMGGDAVAAVAADSEEIAEEAIGLIDVQYEELPYVEDPVEALKPSAPLIHEDRSKYQNAAKLPEGICLATTCSPTCCGKTATSKRVFKKRRGSSSTLFARRFRITATSSPVPARCKFTHDGRVEVWPSNKGPWGLREQMAEDFGVPQEKIKIHIVHVGGDFGAKASLIDVPVAYYLSKATGRPVKLVFDYTDELLAGGHRHPAVLSLRTGVDQDGHFTAIKATIHFSGGAYGSQKPIPK